MSCPRKDEHYTGYSHYGIVFYVQYKPGGGSSIDYSDSQAHNYSIAASGKH